MEPKNMLNRSRFLVIPLFFFSISLIQEKANAESTCSSTYSPPATVEERRSAGLFDGKIGRAAFKNSGSDAITLTLYHPDAPANPFGKFTIEPGQFVYIGADNYGSDWGLQMNDGSICILGKVSDWIENSGNLPYFLVKKDLLNSSADSAFSSLTRKEYFMRGNENYREGDYKEALKDYESAENTPEPNQDSGFRGTYLLPEIFYNRGNTFYKLGSYEKAIEAYAKAIKTQFNQQFPEAYYNKSEVEFLLGRKDEAISDYESLLRLYTPPATQQELDFYKTSGQSIETLDLSNLDGDIFSILENVRWSSAGTRKGPKQPLKDVLGSCKKDIQNKKKKQALIKFLQNKIGSDEALNAASSIEKGRCP
ncbi:tetratricopeptide repeat protein [Phormidesmis sp. 146-35]